MKLPEHPQPGDDIAIKDSHYPPGYTWLEVVATNGMKQYYDVYVMYKGNVLGVNFEYIVDI